MKYLFGLLISFLLFATCNKTGTDDDSSDETPHLKVKFQFNENQERLNNLGIPAQMPNGHAAQNPQFNEMSVHFIELVPNEFTPYKGGQILYEGATLPANNSNPFGFTTAVNFDEAVVVEENETYVEIPIDELEKNTYSHIRVSLTYQNYDIVFNLNNIPSIGDLANQSGTLASFLGYNMYIDQHLVRTEEMDVQDFKLQGFWGFETNFGAPYESYNSLISGQAPESSTTVVNPFPNSPIPPGSCVVSGSMNEPLTITGKETEDVNLVLSFSINKSFEWEDLNANGQWDIDASDPNATEKVVDMGVRGLVGFVE